MLLNKSILTIMLILLSYSPQDKTQRTVVCYNGSISYLYGPVKEVVLSDSHSTNRETLNIKNSRLQSIENVFHGKMSKAMYAYEVNNNGTLSAIIQQVGAIKFKYEYDVSGNISKCFPLNKPPLTPTYFKYNNAGDEIECDFYLNPHSLEARTILNYDEHHNLIRVNYSDEQ